MELLIPMLGGSEWILIILFFGFLLVMPILSIYFYLKSRRLTNDLERANHEKDTLLNKPVGKTS